MGYSTLRIVSGYFLILSVVFLLFQGPMYAGG